MESNFYYRQQMRQERLEARRLAAKRRRVRSLVAVFTFAVMMITIISANSVIAKAGSGYEKHYDKFYTGIMVERGDTVTRIAAEHMTPGYESVEELVEEIVFINGLDGDCTIVSGSMIMIPYYAEG